MLRATAFLYVSIYAFAWSCFAVETELYFTDFEAATAGDGQLTGYDSWVGTPDVGDSWEGIDSEAAPGIGQSAFIGYGSPSGFGTSSVTVARQIPHDPTSSGQSIVRLVAVVGINDSTLPSFNPIRNVFKISFFDNSQFNYTLATLIFNNTEAAFGLWRSDGNSSTPDVDTTEEFILSELQILVAEIDFSANTWSVDLDGFPVFTDATFTANPNASLNFGGVAITWEKGENVFGWGNNWMLFDDWTINADTTKLVIPADPFLLQGVARNASNQAEITWRAQPGFDYQLQYSADATTWHSDLPDSLITESTETDVTYTDSMSAPPSDRLYRVVRTQQG